MEGSLGIDTSIETGISPELHKQAEARMVGRKEINNAGSSRAVDIRKKNKAELEVSGKGLSTSFIRDLQFPVVLLSLFKSGIACQPGLKQSRCHTNNKDD